jgi:hypothetical protein
LEAVTVNINPPISLTDAIQCLPPECKWAVQQFHSSDNGIRIAQAIQNGTAIALSDGSFKDGFGTSAIIIEASDPGDNIIAVNVVPGCKDTQSSFRSKLSGIFGQVIMINTICQLYGITHGSITCGCDGEDALRQSFSPYHTASTKGSQFDLLSAIQTAIKSSPITWKFQHVKGHQDKDADATLDRWAILNIQMDSLAKMYWMEMFHQAPQSTSFITGEYWPVFIQGHKIHSSLQTSLYSSIYQQKMASHWEKKNRFTKDQFMQINWDACEMAMRRLKISRRHWIVKHSEGMCGVGKWLLIWKDRDTDACPLCSAPEDA